MDNQSVISSIIESIKTLPQIDWFITITALIYVFLAAKENVWCWFFGILSCATWAYSSFYNYNLYFDAILNVFYVVMSFIGIYQWKFGRKGKGELAISTMNKDLHLKILIGGILLGFLYGYIFDQYTSAEATYLDALTTVFSVITTILVIQKKLENWLYWIVIDSAYIYIYYNQGAYLLALIMVFYILIAINGYFEWRKKVSIS